MGDPYYEPLIDWPGYLICPDGIILGRSGRPLKGQPNKKGYLRVKLRLPEYARGYGRWKMVHHLVLKQYKGPRPPGLEARHLNGRKDDNSLKNLEWGTFEENGQDNVRLGNYPQTNAPSYAGWYDDDELWPIHEPLCMGTRDN